MGADADLAVVTTGVVVDQMPAMFPGVTRSGDDLIASFSTVADGWPGGAVGVTRSGDDGRSWSRPQLLVEPDDHAGAYLNAVGLTALSDGTILLPFNGVRWTPGEGVAGRRMTLYLLISKDGGGSWIRNDVHVDFAGPCVYGGIVEVDRTLLWPIWGQQRLDERWRSVLLESTDGGLRWRVGATIGYDPDARIAGGYAQPSSSGLDEAGRPKVELTIDPDFRPHSPIDGFTETSVVRVRHNSLLAVLRQQGVGGDETTKLYSARSTDGGRTWNAPALVGFTGMSPVLHAVDDVLLLGTRRRHPNADRGEPGVEVRLSRTCGQSWSEPVLLVDPHGTRYSAEYQCGYPAMVTTDGDRVLVLFYGFTPSGRRYVASNVIRISPLRNKEPVDAEGPSRHSAQ